MRFAPLIAAGGRVLDVAAGRGRHTRFLAARGCAVVAIDRDSAALAGVADLPNVRIVVADLERGPDGDPDDNLDDKAWPFTSTDRFDAIVVTRYLHRPLFPRLLGALADDGLLLYETFAAGNEAYGRPSNPEFLLSENELLDLIANRLTLVAFEQGLRAGAQPAVVQRLAAVGRSRRWPPPLPG